MFFIFIFGCIFIGFFGGIVYLIYNFFRFRLLENGKLSRKRDSQINKAYIIALLLISTVQTYLAYYPTDSFYFREFRSVTLRKPPASAEVIKKTSSYPDFHGDYCSSSLIKLSKDDYIKLYNELLNDKRLLREGKILIAEEFDKVLDRNKRELIITHSFQLIIPNTYGRYNYIGFINDGQTVVIDKCKS